MIIEKFVCLSHRDCLHWNQARKKPMQLSFSVRKYGEGYMAYLVTNYVGKIKKIKQQFGNSLHNLGTLTKKALLEKIESYQGFDEVEKDFIII